MQIKHGKLSIVILCLVTVLSTLAVSGQSEDSTLGVADESTTKFGTRKLAISQHELLNSDTQFDLSMVKRTGPNKIRTSNLFQTKSWSVPPPKVPLQAPVSILPQQPSVQPLPFVYVGRMMDGDEATLFLLKDGQNRMVKIQDIVDGIYQVSTITDKDADFIYLPTGITQKLSFDTILINHPGVGSQSPSSSSTISLLPANAMRPMPITPINLSIPKH